MNPHRIAIVILLFILLILILVGCKSRIQYVPIESVKTESRDKFVRDSIYLKELVRIYQRGDTIFRDSIVYKYKDKLIKDTVKVDSITQVPYAVKGDTVYTNKLNWYQEACIWFTSIVLAASALYLVIKYRGKILSFIRKLVFKV